MVEFEALGSIIKEENLFSITDKVLPNTLVLDSKDPFPGYHHDLPTDTVPKSLFLITSTLYNRENVTRARKNILKYSDFDFDAASGEIFIHNETIPCIRIKNLTSYDQISELQSMFINEGVSFRKYEALASKATIKIRKTFVLSENEEDIFCDKLEDYQGYIRIPKKISWKLFEKITHSVKNNWKGKHFDAALGFFYKDFDIYEMVRIYHRNTQDNMLSELKGLYIKEIAKYQ